MKSEPTLDNSVAVITVESEKGTQDALSDVVKQRSLTLMLKSVGGGPGGEVTPQRCVFLTTIIRVCGLHFMLN